MSAIEATTRRVHIQWRDFHTDEERVLALEEGERVLCVESATRLNPYVRIWIEVPEHIAKRREP